MYEYWKDIANQSKILIRAVKINLQLIAFFYKVAEPPVYRKLILITSKM